MERGGRERGNIIIWCLLERRRRRREWRGRRLGHPGRGGKKTNFYLMRLGTITRGTGSQERPRETQAIPTGGGTARFIILA